MTIRPSNIVCGCCLRARRSTVETNRYGYRFLCEPCENELQEQAAAGKPVSVDADGREVSL